MKRIEFYRNNRSRNLLQIRTVVCVVNILVNLKNEEGQDVTGVEIIPDDYAGDEWDTVGPEQNRVIRRKKP